MAPETVIGPDVLESVELEVIAVIGRPSVIPLLPFVVTLLASDQEPEPAVVKLDKLLVAPTFPVIDRAPPEVRESAPGPSIVLLKVVPLVPPLVTVAVVPEAITTASLNAIVAVEPDPVEIVEAPRPIWVLGLAAVMEIAPVPVVVTEPLVSIWTPFTEEELPAPVKETFPLTAVTLPLELVT